MKFTTWEDRLRFFVPIAILALGALALSGRVVMTHLGKVKSKTALPTPDYEFNKTTSALRGSILGSDGTFWAQSISKWEYRLDPKEINEDPKRPGQQVDPEELQRKIDLVAKTFSLPVGKVVELFKWKEGGNRYIRLAESDSDDVYRVVVASTNRLNGIKAVEKTERSYAQGRHLSHVVGFVSLDPTNSVGGAGIEQKYEKYLKPTPGVIHGEVDAGGREQRNLRDMEIKAKPGSDVYLTIDANIQLETERLLREGIAAHKAEAAWAIVMSVGSGSVLAMVSLPDYEPANFSHCSALVKINRAISEVYEPGSVMKTITACAALNEKMVGPETMIDTHRNDPRYFKLPGDAGHVWEDRMSVRDSLVHSSNIVFGKLGSDLGPERLRSYMIAFGLSRKSGIELPGEEIGLIPPAAKWDKVKWSRAPIGQGVAVTAIQMATAYACIGNGGELLKPHIVEKIVNSAGEVEYQRQREVVGRAISAKTASQVLDMMKGVATKSGTARRAAIPGYSVAGKTGTAQMNDAHGYSSTSYNASFIGIVPASRPEIVVLVTYQRPLYCRSKANSEATGVPIFNHQGGICAAPTFRKIATSALRYLQVDPDIPDEMPDDFEDEP